MKSYLKHGQVCKVRGTVKFFFHSSSLFFLPVVLLLTGEGIGGMQGLQANLDLAEDSCATV
jgi:hypothetical protein